MKINFRNGTKPHTRAKQFSMGDLTLWCTCTIIFCFFSCRLLPKLAYRSQPRRYRPSRREERSRMEHSRTSHWEVSGGDRRSPEAWRSPLVTGGRERSLQLSTIQMWLLPQTRQDPDRLATHPRSNTYHHLERPKQTRRGPGRRRKNVTHQKAASSPSVRRPEGQRPKPQSPRTWRESRTPVGSVTTFAIESGGRLDEAVQRAGDHHPVTARVINAANGAVTRL